MGAGCRFGQRDSGQVRQAVEVNKSSTFVEVKLTRSKRWGGGLGVQDSRLVQRGHGKGGQRSQMCCNERR